MTTNSLGFVHAFLLTAIYVGSLYVWKNPLKLSRNDPLMIRKRMISAIGSTIASLLYVYLAGILHGASDKFLSKLGFHMNFVSHFFACVAAIFLNSLLFAGPLAFEQVYISVTDNGCTFDHNMILKDVKEYFQSVPVITKKVVLWLFDENNPMDVETIMWFRNHILGPLTEEIVFRSCACYILHFACGFSSAWSVLTSSFLFGIAHCHHILEHILHGNMTAQQAVVSVLLQFSYTTLFACYCGFVFTRTGSFWAAFLMHAFCNHMGLPDFPSIINHPTQKKLMRSILVGGLVSFLALFGPITGLFSGSLYQ
ncbi:intramembrane prenyl-peptidase [Acrasis kona]|uniref:intramembrane prenyl-peptidase Rce1 n=1 Tax=Acrasis kona TaxID=1008807 RepID=A0AAW2ZRF8_9EUKA